MQKVNEFEFVKIRLRLTSQGFFVKLANDIEATGKKDDKLGRLDVKLRMKSGKITNIEIQVAKDMDMRERVTFYGSRMLAEQLKSGQAYEELKPVICIVITDYLLIPENDYYHNRYTLYDTNTKSTFTDLLEINTLELGKLPQDSDGNLLWNWLKFLKSETEEDFEMIEETNLELKKAVAIVRELSQYEKMREEYEAREKALRDYNSSIKNAREQGRQEEREKAEKEKLNTARKLLSRGMKVEDVAEDLEFDVEVLSNIKNTLH